MARSRPLAVAILDLTFDPSEDRILGEMLPGRACTEVVAGVDEQRGR